MNSFYITTPLYYVNARPHLGHTYTTVVADCLSRFKKAQGYDVCLLTGTDEHGQNIERAAAAQGVSPSQLADQITAEYQKLWARFGIEYDQFIRTTESRHYAGAAEVFKRASDSGAIYKGQYSGWYCISCNLFAPEGETAPKCEVCERPTERVTEESYFFRLSNFQQRLLDHYAKHPDFIMPPSRRNEVVSFVGGGLKDLSISRTSVKWGIPVPGEQNHVIYVWFDALVGYLTGIGFGRGASAEPFQKYWPAQVQLVGKDILRFHTVYWPAFLIAAGLELPKQVFAHGWWLKDEVKMSKSRGNVIDPDLLLTHFGSDAVRYFLLREVPFGLDGTFSYEAFIQRVNSDLANDFGNLVSRTLTLIAKNFNNVMPYPSAIEGRLALDQELEKKALAVVETYQAQMNELAFSKALESVWDLLAHANRYLNESAPWALTDNFAERPRLATILYTSAEVIRIAALLLAPVLPESCKRVWEQLGMKMPLKSQRINEIKWGGLTVGSSLGEITPIFPRLDKKAVIDKIFQESGASSIGTVAKPEKEAGAGAAAKNTKPQLPTPPAAEGKPAAAPASDGRITIDDFAKVELRVAQVVSAERVAGADKLLKLIVDVGIETRQILAGIAKAYSPESLVGRKIVIVANLQPRKMRGLESNGMLLAASVGDEGQPVLASFIEDVPNGAKLK
ncbi:MAG: methionine--tRNA ligase [Acidobacteria bacterium]|nr:methionine--tRNA ligase [Acidobacteriota bacterium]MCI0719253.1 methionine--tRNA ligase [Acidobacteriota bacterium]